MKINLSPQLRDDKLVVIKTGDRFVINGAVFDFAPLPEGGRLPAEAVACEHVIGDVTRVNGELEMTLLLPIAADATHEECFPEPIVDPVDGQVFLPGDQNAD